MKKILWVEYVMQNLAGLSRTLGGVSDTSSSADKPKLTTEGEGLATKTTQNLRHALGFLWENRFRSFTSPADVRKFVDSLAKMVSNGLLKSGQSFYRTWETKFGQTLPENIEAEYQNFCKWFLKAVDSDDPVATAALVEKRLDGEIHPFADGCGRTAKIMASFVLLQHGFSLPTYKSRKEYYKNINLSDDNEWVDYYRSFFKRREEE